MRKKILAANWKMNLLHDEAVALYKQISEFALNQNVQIYAPSLYLNELTNLEHLQVGAQNYKLFLHRMSMQEMTLQFV